MDDAKPMSSHSGPEGSGRELDWGTHLVVGKRAMSSNMPS
jgi:hypothetical protein